MEDFQGPPWKEIFLRCMSRWGRVSTGGLAELVPVFQHPSIACSMGTIPTQLLQAQQQWQCSVNWLIKVLEQARARLGGPGPKPCVVILSWAPWEPTPALPRACPDPPWVSSRTLCPCSHPSVLLSTGWQQCLPNCSRRHPGSWCLLCVLRATSCVERASAQHSHRPVASCSLSPALP